MDNKENSNDLEKLLWDFVYDLLDDGEAMAMKERVACDPKVAALHDQVKSKAELLAQAARLEVPAIDLRKPGHVLQTEPKVEKPEENLATGATASQQRRAAGRRSRGANWFVGLATVAMVLTVAILCFEPISPINSAAVQRVERQIARQHARVTISGPAKVSPSIENYFTVSMTAMNGEALPADVQCRLYDTRTGNLSFQRDGRTNKNGKMLVSLPPESISPNCRLEIRTTNDGESVELLETHLAVDEIKHVTHIATDKPLYRPGEAVFFRSLTLSRFGLRDDRDLPVQFEIRDPAGNTIAESVQNGFTDHGVGNGMFPISPDWPGGNYTLVARSIGKHFEEVKREFTVQNYRPPRLKKELVFTRDSYGEGDEVVADFSAKRAESGAIAEAKLKISATVDQQVIEIEPAEPKLQGDSNYQIKFKLPDKIEKGAATLSVSIDDGGTQETIAKPIPINLGEVEIRFYPEGGDLVAGLESRVYFHAVDPLGKPVHLEGKVVNDDGDEIVEVKTNERAEGRGVIRITPKSEGSYELKIDRPVGVTGNSSLLKPNAERFVVLESKSDVVGAGKPVELSIRSKTNAPLVVAAVCRGVHVGQQELANSGDVKLDLPPQVHGVIRVTVYDYSQSPPEPLAERLLFRESAQKLNVQIDDDWDEYSPGQHVKASLVITDETNQPVPAVLGVSVVDEALLNLADDKSPRMVTKFLLAGDIERPDQIEDANFFLNDDPDVRQALDLLLGTQGWRRFAGVDKFAQVDLREAVVKAINDDEPLDQRLAELSATAGFSSPPMVFDNFNTVALKYNASLADFRSVRETAIQFAGQIVAVSAVGLLLVLIILTLLRLSAGWKVSVPAWSAAMTCVVIGMFWMSSVVDDRGDVAMVPFANFRIDSLRQRSAEELKQFGIATHGNFDIRFGLHSSDQPRYWERAIDESDFVTWADLPNIEQLQRTWVKDYEFAARFMDPGLDVGGENHWGYNAHFAQNLAQGIDRGKLFNREAQLDLFFDLNGRVRNQNWNHWRGQLFETIDGTPNTFVFGEQVLQQQLRYAIELGDVRRASELIEKYDTAMKKVRFPVRQYAHVHKPASDSVRSDFRETVYWNPLLIADAAGRVDFEFDLSDSVTTFRVTADAHGRGRLGNGEDQVVSRIPFSLEPKLPLEVTAGDRIEVPLAINNDTGAELPVTLNCIHSDLFKLTGDAQRTIAMAANKRGREYYSFDIVGNSGDAELEFLGSAAALTDAIKKSIRVVPPGFPVAKSYGGRIEGPEEFTVVMPDEWVEGSLEVTLQAYPSALADLDRGIDGILREPYGCFEQTSSANYPNVMALRFMQDNEIADPEFTRKAKELLKKGYGRLVGFECSKQGYEWFGKDPGHEALTAYGLMEFHDMSGVWDVDSAMVARTTEWLLKRRDGNGAFKRSSQGLDSFGSATPEITDAYIVWALSESEQKGIHREVEHVVRIAKKSNDPYLISLAAAAAINTGHSEGTSLLTKLATHQHDDGHLVGQSGSITRSGGISLQMETTSLAALAWFKHGEFAPQVVKAVDWITKNRQAGGGFGSTQATILALKALLEHSSMSHKAITDGELIASVNGKPASRMPFKAGARRTIVIDGLSNRFKLGENKLSIELTNANKMPYSLDVSYRTRKPVGDSECPIQIETELAAEKVNAGDVVALSVELSNVSGKGQPMTIAIVGLAAGLEVRPKQLDELKDAHKFDYYETNGRELVFYWRSIGPDVRGKGKISFDMDLIAEIPGQYEGPASRSYLYYTAEQKDWAEPLRIEIER